MGEHASPSYYWDMKARTWAGEVELSTYKQIDPFETVYSQADVPKFVPIMTE